MKKRTEYVNAVLALDQGGFTPVQLQKLFFLLDRQLNQKTGGPYFAFQPYDYGPFDKNIYGVMDRLELAGLLSKVRPADGPRQYVLTAEGRELGRNLADSFGGKLIELIQERIEFVKSLSFVDLVSSIYKAYPEMKANSVFQG